MYQPIMIFLKSGEVGFCTLNYFDSNDLKHQIESISMSRDVDRVEIESHLPKLDLEQLRKDMAVWCKTNEWQHDNLHPDSNLKFNEKIKKEFSVD